MRYLISSLLALVIMCGTAFAQSAYDDVSTDHWAYNALDYLTHRGVLEGYPDGFFKGDRTLTRYEFAQAIARLLDTVGEGSPEDINIMAETLRAEFSDQLASLGGKVDALGNQVNDMHSTMTDLEGSVADNTNRIGSLEDKVSGLKPGPEWKGELRYRWQFEDWANNERFRQRIRFRLGYNKQINDCVMVGFRLETNTGNDATSGNWTLGNNGRTADIFLDQAYFKYSPSWFGYYQDCPEKDCCDKCSSCNGNSCGGSCGQCNSGCNSCGKKEGCTCHAKLDIYGGIFPNILTDPNEMILDDDVNLQGLGIMYHFNEDFQLTSVASVAVEVNGSDYFDDDTYFFATELRHDNFLVDNLDVWVGSYGWKEENNLPASYFTGNGFTLADGSIFDFNGDGVINGLDRFNSNFSVTKAGLQYTWPCTWDKPLSIYGEYMFTCDSDADTNIAIVNGGLASGFIYEDTDDTGFVVGGQYGTKPAHCGDWYTYARYKEIGANTVIHGLADSDTGGANRNSFEWGWQYMWSPNATVGVTYILSKMHNAYGFLIPNNLDDHQTIQLDWIFKF
ncbi:MAG: putative porin [Planctomycetales bacterium]|nr:putative porin [bacterium]UNM07438.1 MAG: putative porin [Planctomycetales bacterium]